MYLGLLASSPSLRRSRFTTFRTSQASPTRSGPQPPDPLEQHGVGQHPGGVDGKLVEHRVLRRRQLSLSRITGSWAGHMLHLPGAKCG